MRVLDGLADWCFRAGDALLIAGCRPPPDATTDPRLDALVDAVLARIVQREADDAPPCSLPNRSDRYTPTALDLEVLSIVEQSNCGLYVLHASARQPRAAYVLHDHDRDRSVRPS
jgi:hypothetical protein